MNKTSPLISVVMPVYNAESYLKVAVDSILRQTYENLELIIVDDASTDSSVLILESLNDTRIKVLKNTENRGNVYSRNRGLAAMGGEYYAPFDADDIAMPDKLEKQLAFLQNYPEYGMIGSWAKLIDENAGELNQKWKLDAPAKRIPAMLLFRNYFVQSSMLIRKEVIPSNGYNPLLITGSDYNMWIEISKQYKSWNYPEYLVQYRVHDKGITQKYSKIVPERDAILYTPHYKALGINLDQRKLRLLRTLKGDKTIEHLYDLKDIESFLIEILQKNYKQKIYNQKELKKVIKNRWYKACYKALGLKHKMLLTFLQSPITGF